MVDGGEAGVLSIRSFRDSDVPPSLRGSLHHLPPPVEPLPVQSVHVLPGQHRPEHAHRQRDGHNSHCLRIRPHYSRPTALHPHAPPHRIGDLLHLAHLHTQSHPGHPRQDQSAINIHMEQGCILHGHSYHQCVIRGRGAPTITAPQVQMGG